MRRDATWSDSKEYHLAGLLLVGASAIVGLVLSLGVLALEQEQRAASAGLAAAVAPEAPTAVSAPIAPPVPTAASGAAPAAPLAPAATSVPAVPAGAPVAADAAAGKAAFSASCNGCHPDGKAGLGPSLLGLSDDAIVGGVRQGKGMMPAYAATQLTDQQLRDVIAFLQALE